MTTLLIFIITLATLFVAIIILILLAVNQHEDDTVYLDCFLDQCSPTEKNKALAERELDMLRYKISAARFKELWIKFQITFK